MSCQLDGGHHHKGERLAIVQASYADPIAGKFLAWHGIGDVPHAGLGVQNHWFVRDRLALGLGVDGLLFEDEGHHVPGVEVSGRVRWYWTEVEDVGNLFFDYATSYVSIRDAIPPGGTKDNYTFSLGPGLEIPLGDKTHLELGAVFHHMSNGRGRHTPRNPSQNEPLVSIGIAWTW